MGGIRHRITVAGLALLALSCASSNELARRSEMALRAHDYERAYHEARAALGKDRSNGRARMALSTAASHLIDQREQRILNLAASDTVAAADACLELEMLRSQALGEGATLPEHPDFAATAGVIRFGAAGLLYRAALESLELDLPKQAYRQLESVRRYRSGYRDIDTRIPKVRQQAITRVAILPFDDETGVPDLSRSIADHMYAELSQRVRSTGFEFTQLVPEDKVYAEMRVSELGDLTRDQAIALGRALGARQVVYGHLGGLRTHSDNDHYHGTIWRKFTERDSSGKSRERYVDIPFDAVDRRRQVELQVAYEVIGVDSETQLAQNSRDLDATARTVYTDYVPEGECGSYCLVPPSLKKTDAERAQRIEQDWKSTFRGWTVPKLLERARRDHERTRYRSEYRGDFLGLDPDHPVFLDDIPPAPELVRIALDDSWKQVLDTLRELDPKD